MRRMIFVVTLCGVALIGPGWASAGELVLAGSVEGAQTNWEDDGVVFAGLRASYRWWPRVSLYLSAKSGAAEVDERGLQRFAVGAELWHPIGALRSYGRLGLVHQHELPRDAIEGDPAGTLLGYGDGIRHRGGLGVAVGAQLPFRTHKAGDFFVAAEIYGDGVVGSVGPDYYWGLGMALGFTYDFGAKKRAKR